MIFSNDVVNCFDVCFKFLFQRLEMVVVIRNDGKKVKVRVRLLFKQFDFCKFQCKNMIILFKIWEKDLNVVYFKLRKLV